MATNQAAERLSSNSAHALELEGVGRVFGALVALADINLRVAAGERRAILGSNGAGKTTLFNAVTGDFPPTSGRIRFFGEDVTDFPVHERIRRGLRRTYQISQLFGGLTVIDSIFVACRGVSRGRLSLLRPSEMRRDDGAGAIDRSLRASRRHPGDAGFDSQPRPAAPARDRAGALGRAAIHPFRRAGRRSVAAGAARPRRNSQRAAGLYRLHHHRARSRRRACEFRPMSR